MSKTNPATENRGWLFGKLIVTGLASAVLLASVTVTHLYIRDTAYLSANVVRLENDLRALQEIVSGAFPMPDTFELLEGDSKEVVQNAITVGLVAALPTVISVVIDNRRHDMHVGQQAFYKFAGQQCKITLVNISASERRAVFQNRCAELADVIEQPIRRRYAPVINAAASQTNH